MTALTELRNRGLVDVLITCGDGLSSLPDAIRALWPRADVQTHRTDPAVEIASMRSLVECTIWSTWPSA